MEAAQLLAETLDFLRPLAQTARTHPRRLKPEIKADGSLVTPVDHEIEAAFRPFALALTPGAGFWGEEEGYTPPTDAGFWVLDPIDGTSNFAFGQALWGVTGAYLRHGKIEAGFLFLPDLGYELAAVRGQGATNHGKPLPAIPPGAIEPYQLVGHGDSYAQLAQATPGKMRHLGSYAAEVGLVALQHLRATVTSRVKLYDCAGGVLICRELGAEIKNLDGTDWDEAKWQNPVPCEPFIIGPANSNVPYDRLPQLLQNHGR